MKKSKKNEDIGSHAEIKISVELDVSAVAEAISMTHEVRTDRATGQCRHSLYFSKHPSRSLLARRMVTLQTLYRVSKRHTKIDRRLHVVDGLLSSKANVFIAALRHLAEKSHCLE